MRQGVRRSMAWLHAWSGLVVGWVLFAVFVTGTASYYRTDISAWMRPELRMGAEIMGTDAGRAADLAAMFLREKMPDAAGWYIAPPKADDPVIQAHWWKSLEGPFHSARLDPESGRPSTARDTKGGDFLYRFHFELSMPPLWGRWIVGLCATIMLVALVSGIVTHRRIFSDFFTFRRRGSARRGWLDAHTVVGVLALPFHLMIAYTGLVTLAPMYMPWGVAAAYPGDELRFYTEAGLMPAMKAPAGRPGALLPLSPMLAQARARVSEPLEGVSVAHPGDAASTVVVFFEEPKGLAHLHPQVAFDGTTGALTGTAGVAQAVVHASTAFVGLHEAHFAGPALRALFFLCGVMGTATVATGLVLWGVARVPKAGERAGLGLRLVRVLNVGTVAGLPVGIAAYFLANRLLPLDLAERASWEVRVFFAAWVLVALGAAVRPHAAAWREGFLLAAALFLAVPPVDALTLGRPVLDEGLRFLGVDAAMAVLGLLAGFAAQRAGRHLAAPDAARRARRIDAADDAMRA